MLYTYWCKWRNKSYPLYHVYVYCLQTIWHHNEGKWHNKEISGVILSGKGVTMVNRPRLKPNHVECIQAILVGKSGLVSRRNISIAEELSRQLEP